MVGKKVFPEEKANNLGTWMKGIAEAYDGVL